MKLPSDLALVGEDKCLNAKIPLPGSLKYSQVFDNVLLQNDVYKNLTNSLLIR